MGFGFASAEATLGFASRFPLHKKNDFFRLAQGLTVSSLGLGTYLGGMDEVSSSKYVQAICSAVRGGVNFLDTSINYRHQRSERDIGAALRLLFDAKDAHRDELVVSTKAGFLTPGAVPSEILQPADIVGGMHSMKPEFLEDQIERSRANLGVDSDRHLLPAQSGNPTGPHSGAGILPSHSRGVRQAGGAGGGGTIRYYGTATWAGYRGLSGHRERLSLARIAEIAKSVAGGGHHFRFVQVPYNMAMTEAFTQRLEPLGEGEPHTLLIWRTCWASLLWRAPASTRRNWLAASTRRLPPACLAQRATPSALFNSPAPPLALPLPWWAWATRTTSRRTWAWPASLRFRWKTISTLPARRTDGYSPTVGNPDTR